MATRLKGGPTRAKNREIMELANAKYPDNSADFKFSTRPSLDQEVASLRTARDEHASDIANMDIGLDWMQPSNRKRVLANLQMAQDGIYDFRNNEEDRKELASLIKASETSKEIANELNAYRQFILTSDLLATPFALGAFQSINLDAGELPQIITPKARQYFNVRSIGQDGGSRQDAWRTTRSALEIEMNALSTDRVEYPIMDLQQGDVNEFDKVQAQLRFDMEMKIDQLARTNIDAGKMTSGIKALLNIHPLIDQNNIPDTNYLDLTDTTAYGTARSLTIQRLKAILGQLAQWGFGFDPDGPIQIKQMIMSPLNARDSWDYVSLVSGWNNAAAKAENNPNNLIMPEQRDAIYSGGQMWNSAWGYNWVNNYNSRITKGRLYVFTNQPVGWYFQKTSFDRTIEWKDTPDHIDQNMAQIAIRKALRFYMPLLWSYRFLIVDF